MSDERIRPLGHESATRGTVTRATAPTPLASQTAPSGDIETRVATNDATMSIASVLRALKSVVPAGGMLASGTELPLERLQIASDPPSVSRCERIEHIRSRLVTPSAVPGVTAFLDGIQRSRLVGNIDGSPLVFGTVAAVIRTRVDRRMETWHSPIVEQALYASRAQLGDALWERMTASGLALVDSSDGLAVDALSPHPAAVRTRALDVIALHRESAERRLSAEWCDAESRWLWIDGGIAGNHAIDEDASVFGVVKSHNTLYGDASSVRDLMALTVGERSSAFLVAHRARRAVASWYLRVHPPQADPLHGLIRVEVAPPALSNSNFASGHHLAGNHRTFTATVDLISSWILAERAPLSLPDARWDTLTYGVYACEQYLKSIVGS